MSWTVLELGASFVAALLVGAMSRTVRIIARESFSHPLMTSVIDRASGEVRVERRSSSRADA